MDRVSKNINERFLNSEDFACFDPRRFNELKRAGIPSSATNKVCELLGDRVNRELLRMQLESFVDSYPRLAMSLPEEFEILGSGREKSEDDGDELDEERHDVSKCKENGKTCKACFTCPYNVLRQCSLNSTAYSELYTVYHFLLTLAITQVECERSFSKLKLIKTRLRSTLSQENLDSLMLMSVESDILNRVSLAKVVDKLASTSKELKRLLTI